jgi:short-subunit dehydrogenase
MGVEALRIELREHGIRVLAVCPGPVHTEFGLVARRDERLPGMPSRECFYVQRERVVAEPLAALDRNRARVFPGFWIAAAAVALSALPVFLPRLALARRPRRVHAKHLR